MPVSAKSASLTQWIFSGARCRCASPTLPEVKPEPFETPKPAKPTIDEPELQNVSSAFPKDRYKPIRELGRGANGVVYLCRDRLLGKKVAVKVLQSLTSESVIDFQREAKIASGLNHPGIVRVLDFGADHGQPFLVMDVVYGVSLRNYIDENGPMMISAFRDVAISILRAVSYAHSCEVVHRDLKPENIWIQSSGKSLAVILDFGLARRVDLGSNTQQGAVVGTPLYMSPEQAIGEQVDWRSDIYSLGCIFHFMLFGEAPFNESEFQQLVFSDEELASNLSSTGDSRVDRVIERMLMKDPNNRCALLEPIVRFLEELPASATATDGGDSSSRNSASKPSDGVFAGDPPVLPSGSLTGSRELDVLVFALAALCIAFAGVTCGVYSDDILSSLGLRKNSKVQRKTLSLVQLLNVLKPGTKVKVTYDGLEYRGTIIEFRNNRYLVRFDSDYFVDSLWIPQTDVSTI